MEVLSTTDAQLSKIGMILWKLPMKRAAIAFVCLLMFFTCAFATPEDQSAHKDAKKPDARTIQLRPVTELREDVDAWPLILNPAHPAEKRVNAALTQLNKELADTLRDCDAGVAEWAKASGAARSAEDPTSGDWVRRVKVTMRGPRFLSMVATDGFFRGGAHPDDNTTVLVFDVKTGALVDWNALMAKSAGTTSPDATVWDEGTTRPIVFPRLQAIYIGAANAYCKDAFEAQQPLLLWPDAEHGTLIALPRGLASCCRILQARVPIDA